jgi:hypothetical protein
MSLVHLRPLLHRRRVVQLAPAAGGFDPASVAGLKLWLKADAITGLSDGDPVGTWEDSSGDNRDATQGTASKKPTYQTGEVNSLPCVRFDGADDYLSFTDPTVATAHTVFLVVKWSAFGGVVLGDSGNYYCPYAAAGNDFYYRAGGGFVNGNPGTLSTGAWYLITVRRSGTTVQFFKNGVQQGSDLTLSDNLDQILDTLGSYAGGSLPSSIDVAEVLIYDSALGATDRGNVESSLISKYGL